MVKDYNFIYLFIGMLGILLAAPLVHVLGPGVAAFTVNASLLTALILGVWSLISNAKWFRAGIGLVVAAVVLTILTFVFESSVMFYLTLVVGLIFLTISIGIAFNSVFLGTVVDVNKIIGAVCIYLMIGIIWAIFYFFLNVLKPGSFSGITTTAMQEQLSEFMYYSFVTLTTLGYGDIIPTEPLARTFSFLEAVLGQIYLTVLVAALVGMHISHRIHKRDH